MFRASRVVLRKLVSHGIYSRRLLGMQAFQACIEVTPNYSQDLSHPLPNLKFPPPLPDDADPPQTKITTLENGVKVASQDLPGSAACIGVFVDSGSMYELDESIGATSVLEKMAFSSTKHRSSQRIMHEVEATGGHVGTSASREQMVYSYDTLKNHLPQAVELLIDCVRNPAFLDEEFQEQVVKIKKNTQEIVNDPQQYLLEALNLSGYSGPLGNPLIAPESALSKLNVSSIQKFHSLNYTGRRIVVAASGVNHEYLLSLVEPLLNDLTMDYPMELRSSRYIGGNFSHKVDSDKTHVALAFEVPGGWRHDENATILTVLQTLLGGGGSFSTGGPGKGMHSRLYRRVLNKYHEIDNFIAFSSIYNETGIFGIQLTTGPDFVETATKVAVDELLAISTLGDVSDLELQRAKNATKSAILMNLESRVVVAEDIGRQILTYGCWKPVEHFLSYIDRMTLGDLVTFSKKMLSSPLTMASWGNVGSVPSYDFVSQYLSSSR